MLWPAALLWGTSASGLFLFSTASRGGCSRQAFPAAAPPQIDGAPSLLTQLEFMHTSCIAYTTTRYRVPLRYSVLKLPRHIPVSSAHPHELLDHGAMAAEVERVYKKKKV